MNMTKPNKNTSTKLKTRASEDCHSCEEKPNVMALCLIPPGVKVTKPISARRLKLEGTTGICLHLWGQLH